MKRLYRLLHAWRLGVQDGWNTPHELGMGYTWPGDYGLNISYDHGVNFGQFLGKLTLR